MSNLEQSIAQWRRQMLAAGLKSPTPLEELENHLREDIRVLLSAGEPEARAFEMAVARLGSPGAVQSEFNKIKRVHIMPVKIISWLWLAAMVAAAAWFTTKLWDGKWSFFVYAHVLSVTAGYTAGFVVGAFGIYLVCWRRSQRLSRVRELSLGRAISLFSRLAAGLVVVGTLLGLPITRRYYGVYWRWDPKEIGALCVIGWLIALTTMQRSGRIGTRGAMLMSIGGNIVFCLAWFGVGILDYHLRLHSSDLMDYWPVAAFLAVNLVFLGMGVVPSNSKAEA